MPEISVIVPVYNAGSYLPECLDSILAQTFRDFELILIDDGSTDRSGAICDEYAKNDPRIRALHQENAGQSAARDRGVREAAAQLLCFIDGDDIAAPLLLELFLGAFRKYDVGVVACDRICGKEPPEDLFPPKCGETEVFEIDEACLLRLLEGNQTIYWTLFPCLLKRSIYLQHPLTPGRVMEDNAVACKWLDAAGRAALIHAPLYFYRENPEGTMHAPFSVKRLDLLWALEEQLAYYEARGYRELLNAVAKEYIYTVQLLAGKVRTELRDEKLARQVLKKLTWMRKRYAGDLALRETEQRRMFKLEHPVLHKLKKKTAVFLPRANDRTRPEGKV